jgi:hypothetical protein
MNRNKARHEIPADLYGTTGCWPSRWRRAGMDNLGGSDAPLVFGRRAEEMLAAPSVTASWCLPPRSGATASLRIRAIPPHAEDYERLLRHCP